MLFRRYGLMELFGAVICMLGVYFLSGLYDLTDHNPIGIIFGSVNSSVWEGVKPVILTYFLYGGLELLSVKPYFRAFVVSKAFGLAVAMVCCLLLGMLTPLAKLVSAFISLTAGFLLSYILMKKNLSGMFSVACFLLLVIFMMYFSFTVNPPALAAFQDPETSLYGIIPSDFDMGAVYLSNV